MTRNPSKHSILIAARQAEVLGRMAGKGRGRKRRGLRQPNGWEAEFAKLYLEPRLRAGEIVWYGFNCWYLPIGDGMKYTPDWIAIAKAPGGAYWIEVIEVKGFARQAGIIRYRSARAQYPWMDFKMFTKSKGKGASATFVEVEV